MKLCIKTDFLEIHIHVKPSSEIKQVVSGSTMPKSQLLGYIVKPNFPGENYSDIREKKVHTLNLTLVPG